jgi:hypothetical protein
MYKYLDRCTDIWTKGWTDDGQTNRCMFGRPTKKQISLCVEYIVLVDMPTYFMNEGLIQFCYDNEYRVAGLADSMADI